MANLKSIDLTEGRRFEQSLEKPILNNNRGISRLKKGEIPHSSQNDGNTSYITTTIGDSQLYIETTAFTYDNLITSVTNTPIIWNINSPTSSTNTFVINNNFIDDINSQFEMVYDWNYSSNSYKTSAWKSKDHVSSDVKSRLRLDPFSEEIWISSSSIKNRMKKEFTEDYTLKQSALKRIASDNVNTKILYDDRDLLRDDNNDNAFYSESFDSLSIRFNKSNENIGMDFYSMEKNLKKKAPFIKRIYTRNRGHSFDSEDFKLEMIKAKENFEKEISVLKL